jgi:hypothetical protein
LRLGRQKLLGRLPRRMRGSPLLVCCHYSRPKGSIMDTSIHDLVAATLAELGLPVPANIIQTMLMRDRYFAGWKFRFDDGYAVLRSGANSIEFYDEQGTVLKTAALGTEQEAA